MVPSGHVAVEGGYLGSPGGQESSSPEIGNVVIKDALTGRIAGGISETLEIGAHVEYASAEWRSTDLSPIGIGTDQAEGYVRGGVSLRSILAGSSDLGFGLVADLSAASLPYRRTLEYEARMWRNSSPERSQQVGHTAAGDVRRKAFVSGSLGLFGSFRLTPWLHLNPGINLETYPYVQGEDRNYVECDSFGSPGDVECPDLEDLDEFDVFGSEIVGTVFLGATVELGPVAFIGQANLTLASDELVQGVPYGIDVLARFTF